MRRMRDLPHRDRVRWKVRLLWLLIAALLVYMVVVGETGGGDSRVMTPLADTFSRVTFFGGLVAAIWRLVYNKRLLRDKLLMRQDAARRRDERQQYLHDKSGGLVVDVLLVCEMFIAMTASMYNMTAFHMASVILLLTAALKALTWCVYRRIS